VRWGLGRDFLAELAPARLSDALEFFIDLLAAVPSVIYGLLGVFHCVPLMRDYAQPAFEEYARIFAAIFWAMYGSVPDRRNRFGDHGDPVHHFCVARGADVRAADQREAALSLGSTRWESTWKVVVPFARTGIMGSIFLALARAAG